MISDSVFRFNGIKITFFHSRHEFHNKLEFMLFFAAGFAHPEFIA